MSVRIDCREMDRSARRSSRRSVPSRSWRTQKGRSRLGRPPTPQAPQARGAQRWSWDAERPRAFECRPLPNQTSNQSAVSSDQVLNESKPVHERHRVPVALAREHGLGPLPSRDIGRVDVDLGCSPHTEVLGS